MPIYDYECKCGNEQEELFPFNKRPKTVKCEACGKKASYKLSVPSHDGIKVDWESGGYKKFITLDREPGGIRSAE